MLDGPLAEGAIAFARGGVASRPERNGPGAGAPILPGKGNFFVRTIFEAGAHGPPLRRWFGGRKQRIDCLVSSVSDDIRKNMDGV